MEHYFVYGLCSDAAFSSYHTASNDKTLVNSELERMRNDEVTAKSEILSLNLPGCTQKNIKILSQDGRCLGRDSIATPPEYKSKALPLKQPAQSNVAEVLLRNSHLVHCTINFLSLIESEVPLQSSHKPHISHVYCILSFIFLIPHTHISHHFKRRKHSNNQS